MKMVDGFGKFCSCCKIKKWKSNFKISLDIIIVTFEYRKTYSTDWNAHVMSYVFMRWNIWPWLRWLESDGFLWLNVLWHKFSLEWSIFWGWSYLRWTVSKLIFIQTIFMFVQLPDSNIDWNINFGDILPIHRGK